MIFDKIENRKTYFRHEIFNKIFKDFNKIKIDTTNGIHFKNDDYYFKVMSYKTQIDPHVIENHKKEVIYKYCYQEAKKLNYILKIALRC